jgi:hypothetical protein
LANGISFNATCSPHYREMVKKIIVVGPTYIPPVYNKMRTSFLDKGVVIAQVVGWEKPDPTTKQVLQLGNPTPNVTSM